MPADADGDAAKLPGMDDAAMELPVTDDAAKELPVTDDAASDAFLMNGAALAYIGDAVFELLVRRYVLGHGSKQPDRLHKHATALVNAAAQSAMINAISEELSEEERSIFRRGRNASTATSARHQTIQDYRRATGLEALFGYLYLCGRTARMRELFQLGLEKTGVSGTGPAEGNNGVTNE